MGDASRKRRGAGGDHFLATTDRGVQDERRTVATDRTASRRVRRGCGVGVGPRIAEGMSGGFGTPAQLAD